MAIDKLLQFNRDWAKRTREEEPEFFKKHAVQQSPEFLWIGCSDSRMQLYALTGMAIGEAFIHRNIANLVVHSDLNCLSVMQYAIDVLKVRHILVVGHYGCGGVSAALNRQRVGLADNWLRHIRDVRDKHQELIDATDPEKRLNRLCELNTIEQMSNVCQTLVVQDAWDRGQELSVNGWIYDMKEGLIHKLCKAVTSRNQAKPHYREAIRKIADA